MQQHPIIYRSLLLLILSQGMSQAEVARHLGINCNTLRNKLRGITPFTLNEAIQIKRLLGRQEALENLFKRWDEGRAVE